MREDRLSGGGLPNESSLNFNFTEANSFEPTKEQVELIKGDLERIADGVRPHLTGGFAVSTRVTETSSGPLGVILVSFPTGDAIGPSIELTPDMFDGADEPDWDGPIPEDEIVTMGRQIASITVAQWAQLAGMGVSDQAPPAK